MKNYEVDVVVVGAGPSGLAASVQAAEDGAKVLVLNKADVVGGAANMGMGPLGIGTKQQQDQMIDISVEKAFKMFMDYTHWRVDANLVKKYFEASKGTIEWLEDMGVEFAGAYPYFPKSESTWHIVAVNGGIGRNGGAIMNKAMMEKGQELGVEYLNGVTVESIIMKDGKVAGVTAKDSNGEEIEVKAKAAIVGTGGAGDNPEVIKERMGYTWGVDMFNFRIPGLKGDGIRMVMEAGGATTDMSVEMIYTLPNTDMIEPLPAVFMQPNLMVNKFGRRFINEEQMQNTTFTGNAINIQKGSVGYSIFDSAILKGYKKRGLDVVNFVHHPENLDEFDAVLDEQIAAKNPDVYKADSIEELAEMIGVDAEALQDTIDEYNDMCDSYDEQFFKERRFMKPIRKAPYYAGAFHPAGYGTLGGIKINEDCQVMTDNWETIPGLYACGTDTCTIYGDSYMFLLPGNTMGYCLNTGRFAGEGAAAYCDET